MCDSWFKLLDRHWNRLPVTPTVFSVLPDHHQSAAAVLCPAGQELPVLLREGEDSECYVAPQLPPSLSAPRTFTALWTLPSVWSRWIFNLSPLPTFQLPPLVVCLVSFRLLLRWLLLLALGLFFGLIPTFLASPLDSFVSFSSRACWWTTSSRWGSCWRRCLNRWEPNRWDAAKTRVTRPISCSKTPGPCELQQAFDESKAAAWTVLRSVSIHLGPLKWFSLLLLLLQLFHTHRVREKHTADVSPDVKAL